MIPVILRSRALARRLEGWATIRPPSFEARRRRLAPQDDDSEIAKDKAMRKKLTRRDVIKGSAALGLTVFAAPARAAAPEPVAITPALVEAARKEAKVILYSSMDLPVGEKLGRAFEAQYP